MFAIVFYKYYRYIYANLQSIMYYICSGMYHEVHVYSLTNCSHKWYVVYCMVGENITLQMGVLTVATNSHQVWV